MKYVGGLKCTCLNLLCWSALELLRLNASYIRLLLCTTSPGLDSQQPSICTTSKMLCCFIPAEDIDLWSLGFCCFGVFFFLFWGCLGFFLVFCCFWFFGVFFFIKKVEKWCSNHCNKMVLCPIFAIIFD